MPSLRNIGIFAHVDAGKTTLSEQLLVHTGTVRQAGSVDRGTAHTDALPVEQRRGISVRAACVSMTWKDHVITLIDTPGHMDFSAEVERSFWALDGAVLVCDAAEGLHPQTEQLFHALKKQGLPFLIFLNKTDRDIADPQRTLTQIKHRLTKDILITWDEERFCEEVCSRDDDLMERWLGGDVIGKASLEQKAAELSQSGLIHPVFKGSALKDAGIEELLSAILRYLPPPKPVHSLCGIAFSTAEDRTLGRGLWVRLFGGELKSRMPLELSEGTDPMTGESIPVQKKITCIRDAAGRDRPVLAAGETGIIYGLGDTPIGHIFGEASLLPRKVDPGSYRTPLLCVRVIPENAEQMPALRKACEVLSREDPLLNVEYIRATDELCLNVMGKVQLEILEEELRTRFSLQVSFCPPRVIYRETIQNKAPGYVAYTMPKPCWAIMEFELSPAPRGSGISFTSLVQDRDILMRYQHQVEQALPIALRQGRLGWQVTDIEIKLVGGNYHQWHTHPLDFIVATPMGIQDGLRRAGSVLLQPILECCFTLPADCTGRVMSDIDRMRGEIVENQPDQETTLLTALVPVSTSMDYITELASITGGRGSMSTRLHSWRECPLQKGAAAERRGVDPLDTARYILAARSALEGNLFDF